LSYILFLIRIHLWDINNEMLHGSFYSDATNVTIRDWMYYEAHKIHPGGEMFVNEYEVLSAPWMTQVCACCNVETKHKRTLRSYIKNLKISFNELS